MQNVDHGDHMAYQSASISYGGGGGEIGAESASQIMLFVGLAFSPLL
jgi:hypothetical protein